MSELSYGKWIEKQREEDKKRYGIENWYEMAGVSNVEHKKILKEEKDGVKMDKEVYASGTHYIAPGVKADIEHEYKDGEYKGLKVTHFKEAKEMEKTNKFPLIEKTEKLLTNGQMIDTLQIGEVAENQYGGKVRRTDKGYFVNDSEIPFNPVNHTLFWSILPKPIEYVSFLDAMEAFQFGKTVIAHDSEGGTYYFSPGMTFKELAKDYPIVSLYELVEQMDWSVEK